MNVIFLDVDGVLAYRHYKNKETAHIDPEKVKMLKEICDKSNAQVVISSSWKDRDKNNKIAKIYYNLIAILKQFNITVLGNTPNIPEEYEEELPEIINLNDVANLPKPKHGTGRAAEIQKYIQENNIKNFVILDDEDYSWADYNYESHWIQPSWYTQGLQQDHVKTAITILKGENYETN